MEKYLVVSPPINLTSPSYTAYSLFQIAPLQQVRKDCVSPYCNNSCLTICLGCIDDTACSFISSWLISELLVHPCMLLSYLWSSLCHSSIHGGKSTAVSQVVPAWNWSDQKIMSPFFWIMYSREGWKLASELRKFWKQLFDFPTKESGQVCWK